MQKNEHRYWILYIRISRSTNFQLKLTNAIFWTKFDKKNSYFQSKSDKIDTTIEFCIFEKIFVSNFTTDKKILDFGTKFVQPSGHETSFGRPMDVYMKSGLYIDVHWTSKGRLIPNGKKDDYIQKQKKWTSSLHSAYSN